MKPVRALLWSSASLLAATIPGVVAATAIPTVVEAPASLQELLLSVSVNGGAASQPALLLRGADGAFYAPERLIAQWRLTLPSTSTIVRDGQRFVRLDSIAGLSLAFDDAEQTLALTASPGLLEPTCLAYAPVEVGDEVVSGTGAFFNYDVSAEHSEGATTLGGSFEAGLFTSHGVGLSSFVGQWSGHSRSLVRLDSNWTIDDPAHMRSLRLGDSISRGGVGGGPLRFGGIQLARNFAEQPGFVTIPLPAIGGSAALPSIVDIYVNDALRGSRDVPPGPFEISDLPVVSGNGEVQLIVRDLLGREQLYSQSYYSAPALLAPGLTDYSIEAGLLRRNFGRRSNDYGAGMLSTTGRYGFNEALTGEAHVEATRAIQVAGAGAALAIGGIGIAEAKLAASESSAGAGGLVGLSLERRSAALSLGVSAELTSNRYRTLGLAPGRRPPASLVQAFAGIPFGSGSLGLSYLRRKGRGEPDVEYAGANASLRLGRLGNLSLAGRKNLTGKRDLAADLFLVMPLGRRASASAGASLGPDGTIFNAIVQRSGPVGAGIGYRLAASTGAFTRLDGRIDVQTSFGAYDAQLTWRDGRTGVRLSTAGGIGLVGGHLFAARQLTQSFAAVEVGHYPGVRVYADNQLVGRTDRNGRIIVPRLRAYDRNRVRIEVADLPLDAEVTEDEHVVRPADRSGVEVRFAAAPAHAAIVRLLFADGSALPPGATVTLTGQAGEWISAPGGDVYLTGLGADNAGTATWSGGRCAFHFAFVASADSQPRLGDLVCRTAEQ